MTAVGSRRLRQAALAVAGFGLILAGLSALLLLKPILSGIGSAWENRAVKPANVEFEAPELSLRDTSGRPGRLDDFRGQVVLVNLWATWCPPCRVEMPALQSFYEKHRSSGFTVIAINDGEPADVVRRFEIDRGLTFPVWVDPTYRASEVAFRAASLPTSFVIDRVGIVRLMWIGSVDVATLDQYVLPLVKE